jgi:hypothetical protein
MREDKQPDKRRTKAEPPSDSFTPFADDAGVRNIGALCFENGTDRIALHGSLDLTRDKTGLAQAQLLQQTLDAIVKALEGDDLPEAVSEAREAAPRSVPNPFA